jgi:Flp pilus assembly protein TadG
VTVPLTLAFLIGLTMYIVQMSIIMYAYASLKQVARESARYAAVNALQQNDTLITNQIAVYCNGTGIEYSDITPTINPVANSAERNSNLPITVSLAYNMSKKFILPKSFPGMGVIKSTYNTAATCIIE